MFPREIENNSLCTIWGAKKYIMDVEVVSDPAILMVHHNYTN